MINLTVVNIKDVIKYLIKVTLSIIIIVTIIRFFCVLKNKNITEIKNVETLKYCIKEVIPLFKQLENKEESFDNINEGYKFALNSELELATAITSRNIQGNRQNSEAVQEIDEETNAQTIQTSNQQNNTQETANNQILEEIPTNVQTEVLDTTYSKYTNELYGVKVKNESCKEIISENVNPDTLEINKNNILIFHTHTCESYTASEKNQYQSTGNYRTTDLNYSVSRVGDELEKYLNLIGKSVFHDKTYHDYPAYSGSYGRSLKTVQNLLKVYQNTDIVIDLHRDAIGDNTYAPKVKIGDEIAAQLMFVIGTDGSGLQHDNWEENLKFAIKVQQVADKLYPGLFKTILVRDSRYNQHLAKGACIIEVGATGNTLEECLTSMKYLSKVFENL